MNVRKQQVLQTLSLKIKTKKKTKSLEDKMSVTNFEFGNIIIVSLIVIYLQVFNLILNKLEMNNKRDDLIVTHKLKEM